MAGRATIVSGSIVAADCSGTMNLARSQLATESAIEYQIPPWTWRTWDAMATNLPATGGTDDLGFYTGTLGTDAPTIQTGDLKAAGSTTRYARTIVAVPPEYVAASSFSIVASAGMKTTVADTAATIDFECRLINSTGGVGSDLVTTSATSINSLTAADKTFSVTGTSVAVGDMLDIRMAILVNDAATGTAVIGAAWDVRVKFDIKG